ncbi:hypothetical protein G9A89_016523 [Geosiphon pyriformis]|nr:hypothetical protein G9A89_016523 [Geosiphon pyriformis]
MKKVVKDSGSGGGFKPVLSKKKRKSITLEKGIGSKGVSTEVPRNHSWGSETGDTTKSESIDMEEECLIEETSFDYGEKSILMDRDHEHTSKKPSVKTTKALGKSLSKINFLGHDDNDDDDNVLSNTSLELPSLLKNLVPVSVRKSFALNIGLDKVIGKSAQDKLAVIRKLFSKINGFGGAFTSSKFAEIIRAMFTSESSLAQATEKTRAVDILINTNLKKSTGRLDWTVVVKEIPVEMSAEAVHTALSKFVQVARSDVDKKSWNARNVYKALLYTLPIGTNAHDIWDYVTSMGKKTCTIDCHLVTYAQLRCTTVCFNSAELLETVIKTMPVLKEANLHWSNLISAKYAGCRKLDHTSLACPVGEKKSSLSGALPQKTLSNSDKSRLAAIYTKCSASVACPVSFSGMSWTQIAGSFSVPFSLVQNGLLNADSSLEIKPTPLVSSELDNRFAILECSLASLIECIDELAKKLDAPKLMVSQLSPGCQLLMTPLSQNQKVDIVMSESLDVATSGETVPGAVGFDVSVVSKMEEILCNLSIMVMGLLAKIDNAGLVPAQKNIVCWHVNSGSMVSIVMKTKLRANTKPWIINKFNKMRIFSSGLDKEFLGTEVAIIMNNFFVCYVAKIEKISGHLISIWLLFKSKMFVVFLGIYTVCEINSLIAKAANFFTFVVLDGDFNEDGIKKSASFKFCSHLGQFLECCEGYRLHFFSSVSDFFDTNHNAVLVSISLGGLLDAQLSNMYKQANKDRWKFRIKDADADK